MNAFHPDFFKTYYPKFWDFSKSQQALTAEREMAKRTVKPKQFYVFALASNIRPSKRNYAKL
tara:strand:- start:273 stop:458 length:186 start_codon:yes stop_codon:yes gene_type:complete